ncbi:MAG: DUF4831 family protein [Bacteroidales bacterium]|nr:DUF4831 family protein [Bacteroidales bacterium]
MMKRHIAFFALGLMIATLSAQQVTRVHVGDNQNYGITYSLPATLVRVTADATCSTVRAGIYAPYAEKYLGVKDAPMEDMVTWTITSVDIKAESEADTTRTFHVNFGEKVVAPTFYLAPGGVLAGINREPEAIGHKCEKSVPAKADTPTVHAVDVMNEELLKAGSKSKQAEIAARQIFRIRESRLNILTGDVDNLPADGASFQLVLENLAAQEAAYMELFTGTSSTTAVHRDFVYRPTAEGNDVLFRFSRHFGFVAADDLSGEPYRIGVTVTDDKRNVPVLTDAKGKAKPQASGVAYIVPGRAQVTVSHKGNRVEQGEWAMPQFGHVEYLLPTQFTDKKKPASALFDPLTGALQLFQTEN